MANKKISGYTEVTTYDDTSFYLLENSSGYYRKQSSSRLTRVITSSATYTIGTGGDYANFVTAMAYLKNKWIPSGVIITLRLCSDLHLTTRSSYTFYSESYAILHMKHPCSKNIFIDLYGYNIDIGDGTDDCQGFLASQNTTLNITNSQVSTSIIKSNKNASGYGLKANKFSNIYINNIDSHRIQIGTSGYGFYNSILCDGGMVSAGYSNIYYASNYGVSAMFGAVIYSPHIDIADCSPGGFYSLFGAYIYRNGATGAQATSASPTIGVESSDGSRIM